MTGQQPQRPYGPPFNHYLPMSSSPAINYGMQSHPNQPPTYNGYWQGQASPNGMPFPPNTNGSAHHANAQSSIPPAFPARVAPTSFGGYPGMSQYNAPPTQFFPTPLSTSYATAPSPYATAPYIPQSTVSENASHNTVAINPGKEQTLSKIPFADVEEVAAAKENGIDLEDGELSSGEQEMSSGESHEKSAAAHERPAPETLHAKNSEPQGVAGQQEESNAVYQTSKSRHYASGTHITSIISTHSIREQARHILQELHSFNIGFEDIAKEAFDVGLLRELFVEAGLPIPAIEEQEHQHSRAEESIRLATPEHGDHERSENSANGVRLDSSVQPATLGRNKDVSVTAEPGDTHPIMSTPSALAAPAQEPPVNKTSVKVPAPKQLDRKDYIARLMAAKIGKPSQNSEGAPETPPVLAETQGTASSAENVTTDAADIAPAQNPTAQHVGSSPASGGVRKDMSAVETKRKEQTDLALQKMEALRAQKKLQEQPQSSNLKNKEPRSVSLDVEMANSAPAISDENTRPAEGPSPVDGRQTSYFSPVSLKPAFSIPGLFTMPQETSTVSVKERSEPAKPLESLLAAEDGDSTDTGIGPRKRLKAADFMEMTSNTLHKSLSKGEDTGVVIDISDDEMEHSHDNFDPQTSSKIPHTSASALRRGNEDGEFVNPLDSSTPNKLQEPQELRMKESEIQSMNRKILELEQRIKAKQAASRVQSPRHPTISSSNDVMASESRQPSALAQHAENATEEQLVKEKERQEDKLATAEAEQVQIAKKTDEMIVESCFEYQGSNEAAIAHRASSNSGFGKEEHSRAPKDASSSIDQQKTKLQNEVSSLETAIASSQEEMRIAKVDTDRLSEKLDAAKRDMERRHTELQHKVDRRQLLQQQLANVPSPRPTTHETWYMPRGAIEIESDERSGDVEGSPISDLSQDILPQSAAVNSNRALSTQPDRLDSPAQDKQQDDLAGTETIDPALESTKAETRPFSPLNCLHNSDHSSDGAIEEDPMDISASDMDNGQVVESRRESTSKQEQDMDFSDDDDFYEPPSHIGSIQQPTASVPENQPHVDDPELLPMTKDASPVGSGGLVDHEVVDDIISAQQENGAHQALDHGSVFEHGKDEDDYEPPEPEPEPGLESTENKDTDPVADSSPLHQSTNDESIGNTTKDEQPATKKVLEGEHFIPYESPLRQFSSYRFHPEYRNEVPGGYRSLTYSNDIQPDVEICQYELSGGVCNDESCTSQHFSKMALPDHIILTAMGKGEGATTEQKNDYVEGLRTLILDLRERKIKDLDAIAEAIAQYRLKFLNDSSRAFLL